MEKNVKQIVEQGSVCVENFHQEMAFFQIDDLR